MKLTQQDMARLLKIDARTLRNWRKDRPFLYDIIMKGFAYDNFIIELEEKLDSLKKLKIHIEFNK